MASVMNESRPRDGGSRTELEQTARRVVKRLRSAFFLPPKVSSQGAHIDPIEQPAASPSYWPKDWQTAWFSSEMSAFRGCLQSAGLDVRDSILSDLSSYYALPTDECRRRCIHWEEWSVAEWRAGDRSTREGLKDFYASVQSWAFDLLWHAYLQSSGYAFPGSVLAAGFAMQRCPRGQHLDFGSGAGVTNQLFHSLGFPSTAADVSKSLLDFASWRFERHDQRIATLDLNVERLPVNSYDVVTAIDTLVHVPDFDVVARQIHSAIRPGGWLLTNFDVRASEEDGGAWHLHDDELLLECRLEAAGFVRRRTLGGVMLCYQRVEPNSARHRARMLRNQAILRSPAREVITVARNTRWPTAGRVTRAIGRLLGRG